MDNTYESISKYDPMTQERLAKMSRHERFMYYSDLYQYFGAALFTMTDITHNEDFEDAVAGEFGMIGSIYSSHMALVNALGALTDIMEPYYDDEQEGAA